MLGLEGVICFLCAFLGSSKAEGGSSDIGNV